MAKLLNDEEMQKLRKEKQLAILKASNKLLEEAKETVMSTDKLSDFDKTELKMHRMRIFLKVRLIYNLLKKILMMLNLVM